MMEFSSSSSSGSSKRAKTPTLAGNISVNVSCLVDGCNSDLSQCREYHRRHKVCELHSKTPKVTIGGREQRFCQQCSRFHSLVEFDEGKRSCRKRLDGHNRRRRKPQVDSLSRTSGMFLSNQQGTTILSFSDPQIHPNPMVSSSWAGLVKPEPETIVFDNHLPVTYIDHPNLFPESSSATAQSYKGGGINQFQFFQSTDEANRAGDSRSDRALSLLSSPLPAQTTPEIVPQPNPINSNSLECGGFSQYASFSQEMDNETILPDSNHDSTLHFQGMFHNGRDGSSPSGGNHQTLSFRWD